MRTVNLPYCKKCWIRIRHLVPTWRQMPLCWRENGDYCALGLCCNRLSHFNRHSLVIWMASLCYVLVSSSFPNSRALFSYCSCGIVQALLISPKSLAFSCVQSRNFYRNQAERVWHLLFCCSRFLRYAARSEALRDVSFHIRHFSAVQVTDAARCATHGTFNTGYRKEAATHCIIKFLYVGCVGTSLFCIIVLNRYDICPHKNVWCYDNKRRFYCNVCPDLRNFCGLVTWMFVSLLVSHRN
jgi:hypothetical protein